MQTYFHSRLTSRNAKIRAPVAPSPGSQTIQPDPGIPLTHTEVQNEPGNAGPRNRIEPWRQRGGVTEGFNPQHRYTAHDLVPFYAQTFLGSPLEVFLSLKDANRLRLVLVVYYGHECSEHRSVSTEIPDTGPSIPGPEILPVRSFTAAVRLAARESHAFPVTARPPKTPTPAQEFRRFDRLFHARKFEPEVYRRRWLATPESAARIELAKQTGISELDGLKIVGDTWANPVPLEAIFERLEFLVETKLTCTVEIATEPRRLIRNGGLLQMELKQDELKLAGVDWDSTTPRSRIASAWLVGNPASGRIEYSIELFDRAGRMTIRFSENGDSLERAVWQDLLGTLPTLS